MELAMTGQNFLTTVCQAKCQAKFWWNK
jgi:hypothetical protein